MAGLLCFCQSGQLILPGDYYEKTKVAKSGKTLNTAAVIM